MSRLLLALVYCTTLALVPQCNALAVQRCTVKMCFLNKQSMAEYERQYGCTFSRSNTCHAANATDIFRWAISQEESAIFGFRPGVNPCNAHDHYCAARTGNPASAGQSAYYASSYGRTQITLKLLIDWLIHSNRFQTIPDCLTSILQSPQAMQAIRDAHRRFIFVDNLVRRRRIPAAVVDSQGNIHYPAYPSGKLGHQYQGNGVSRELFERMAVWERVRQMIEAAHINFTDGLRIEHTLNPQGSTRAPFTPPNMEFGALLRRLGMVFSSYPHSRNYTGVNVYIHYGSQFPAGVRKPQYWAEAAHDFGNAAIFSTAPSSLFSQLMTFYGSGDCYREATDQMFRLPHFGYRESLSDPANSHTRAWIKAAAGAWNGSGRNGSYAGRVLHNYRRYYAQYFGKKQVCNGAGQAR